MNVISQWFADRKAAQIKIQEAVDAAEKLSKQVAEEKSHLAVLMDSDVPWIKLIGEDYDLESPPADSIDDRYKWNKAFIKKLRREGVAGTSDQEMIANWEIAEATVRMKKVAEYARTVRRASSEPWVEIISENYDTETKQVEIKLDWNPAFILMLRHNGYTASDEHVMVDQWFKRLSESIAGDIHNADYK